jgi:5-methyltetrahydropteroyltriglutamate--homocysteine methyltransferase
VRICTTHAGSLPRPPDLVPMVTAHEAGDTVPGIEAAVGRAVAECVAAQAAAGIDIINDGEQGRRTYASYALERLRGFEPAEPLVPRHQLDSDDFPDFAELVARLDPSLAAVPQLPACTGPISVRDPGAVHRDIERLATAAKRASVGTGRIFMTAVSPGTFAVFVENHFYPSREEYLGALAEALAPEYQAITDAGFTLQVDCPDMAMRFCQSTEEEIRREVAESVAAVNAATAGILPDRMRLHVCWGNMEKPHVHDVPLASVIDLIVQARPAGISLEAANPRHGHEWKVFEQFALPDDKYVLPGVIDTTTNFVEHPELVAQRIGNYARIVGPDRVIATTDCGFGSHAGAARVARSVAWAKLRAMVEGAELASRAWSDGH